MLGVEQVCVQMLTRDSSFRHNKLKSKNSISSKERQSNDEALPYNQNFMSANNCCLRKSMHTPYKQDDSQTKGRTSIYYGSTSIRTSAKFLDRIQCVATNQSFNRQRVVEQTRCSQTTICSRWRSDQLSASCKISMTQAIYSFSSEFSRDQHVAEMTKRMSTCLSCRLSAAGFLSLLLG